ncbi:MAG TPA: YdeI/OmpD-associated family protein [Candidatus Saccharimonadales bacterium]|jgi:hypothetical protein|nr:YdeI/OmpD-associated family protein [Candidatus Saccharimonadales bacterium]
MPNTEHIFEIPHNIRSVLQLEGALGAFELRPLDQQKGYVHWLQTAKDLRTREHRMTLIIEELHAGVYNGPGQKGNS